MISRTGQRAENLGSNEHVVMSSVVRPCVYIVVCNKVWELH